MGLDLANYEKKARAAVRKFWATRLKAAKKQRAAGKKDQGERAAVTAGKNMDGFIRLGVDIVQANGLVDADIMLEQRVLTLPGYFRPVKLWDLLVLHKGKLIAVLEFKSHVGPSFGNNFNNRCEESLGSAIDLRTAYREGAFGDIRRPFVGYLILVEDAPKSRSPVKSNSPHFPIFPEFEDTSYAERYNILCRKLVQEGLYTAASVLLTPRNASRSGEYSELSKVTGLKTFVTTLAGHIATEAAL
jgi:hypothetical protein